MLATREGLVRANRTVRRRSPGEIRPTRAATVPIEERSRPHLTRARRVTGGVNNQNPQRPTPTDRHHNPVATVILHPRHQHLAHHPHHRLSTSRAAPANCSSDSRARRRTRHATRSQYRCNRQASRALANSSGPGSTSQSSRFTATSRRVRSGRARPARRQRGETAGGKGFGVEVPLDRTPLQETRRAVGGHPVPVTPDRFHRNASTVTEFGGGLHRSG